MQALSENELHAAVKVRQSIFDSDVRSSDYVNRAKILAGDSAAAGLSTSAPADSINHIDVATIGSLVPAVRMQVDRALFPDAGS